jgi:hypothetical protein
LPEPTPSPLPPPDTYARHVGALRRFEETETPWAFTVTYGFIDHNGREQRVTCDVSKTEHEWQVEHYGYDEADLNRRLNSGASPLMLGIINATTEWIFAFAGRLSVTISNADRLMDVPRAMLAQTIWREVSRATGIATALPPWQIVRERRATFAATPEENAKRPGARTPWGNLMLAGDWTATGLPATLESAVRSGNRAAEVVMIGNKV